MLFNSLGEYRSRCQAAAKAAVAATTGNSPIGPLQAPSDADATVTERKVQRAKPPHLYQVLLLNDDYTPMEFVVMVLQEFFRHDLDTATLIMLKIHTRDEVSAGCSARMWRRPRSSWCLPRRNAPGILCNV